MKKTIIEVIKKRVKGFIKRYKMFEDVEKAIIAFSTGPDSVCLLDVLKSIFGEKIKFTLVYINHMLRPSVVLKKEEDMVKFYAQKYNCDYKVIRIKKIEKRKKGIEAEARNKRYYALMKYGQKISAQRIILGHNLDDFVETFFLNLLRGSGARGLSSIPPVRLPFVRPLLDLKKEEILRYLQARKLKFKEDKTNRDLKFRRNLLRQKIIPELLRINPKLLKIIKKESEIIKGDDEYLWEISQRVYNKLVEQKNGYISLDINRIIHYNKSISSRVIMRAIEDLRGDLEGYESKHIEAILGLKGRISGKRIVLPKGLFAQRIYDKIYIGFIKDKRLLSFYREIGLNDEVIVGDFKIKTRILPLGANDKENGEVFDLKEVLPPLYIRNPRTGDFIEIKSGRAKLKKIMNEAKVPVIERPNVKLLCDQRGILWAINLKRAYRGFVDEKTQKILKVEVERV